MVPSALYRHVRSKEQLCDLAVDLVLAEVDTQPGHDSGCAGQVKVLARRLLAALEDHPGIAALLKTRDPLGPHSLALAEAFQSALQHAGFPARDTAQAFSLVYDYTLGFALTDRTTVNEQRVQDPENRRQLHAFVRSLPADRLRPWLPPASTCGPATATGDSLPPLHGLAQGGLAADRQSGLIGRYAVTGIACAATRAGAPA